MHVKFKPVKGKPFSSALAGSINLYQTEDKEIFTSMESVYEYLWKKERGVK